MTVDDSLAIAVQCDVPLVTDPWKPLGERVGLTRDGVLERLDRWRINGALRGICARVSASAIEYETAIVAAKVGHADLDLVARTVCDHAAVASAWLVDHPYGLWFSLAAPRTIGLELTLSALSQLTGGARFVALRRTMTFKAGMNLDPSRRTNRTEPIDTSRVSPLRPGELALGLLRALESPLPIVTRPFARVAEQVGVEERDLLAFAGLHLGGALRRYAAWLDPSVLGVNGHALVAFSVPPSQLGRVGKALSLVPEVSHCWARSPLPGFTYTLYAMVHGADERVCRQTAMALSHGVCVPASGVIVCGREIKSGPTRYLTYDIRHNTPSQQPFRGGHTADW